ncbi:MAG: L-2-amino-thiazoline-4-carboxylic acid hydrolase [Lachnospiraceae bacterium]|nr:L-2-amino-thiazoline-4-carboxylic acid hydrolase [Lachnospiraceae bacterium]
MKLDKLYMFKGFKKELVTKYGAEAAARIWNKANEEYERLLMKEPDADKSSKSFAFPAVAIYRAVEEYTPEDALSLTRAFGTKTGLKLKKIFSRITSLPGIPKLMWRNMDKLAAKMSDGYETKNVCVNADICSMDVIGCPLYDKAKELETPEAVQMICCMDKEYMTGFRGIDYKRTKSVAEGDDCCDYRLKRC